MVAGLRMTLRSPGCMEVGHVQVEALGIVTDRKKRNRRTLPKRLLVPRGDQMRTLSERAT